MPPEPLREPPELRRELAMLPELPEPPELAVLRELLHELVHEPVPRAATVAEQPPSGVGRC